MFQGCLLLLLLTALRSPGEAHSQKIDPRSYQLSPIPLINGVQGVQYVPMVYSELPTVLVPKQIGMDVMALHSTPTPSAVLPPHVMLHHKYFETSTPLYQSASVQESVLQAIKPYERQAPTYSVRPKKIPVYAAKRPTYHSLGRKKLGGHYQNQKVSSISIEPSIDLTDQLQQLQSSYPSTTPAPVSTYGPAKALDHHSGMPHVSTYLRPKGHHPHPHYHPKDYKVFSHYHKGHVHNHHIPPGYPVHKSQYHSSAKPVYPSLLKPASSPAYIPIEDPSDTGYKQDKEPSYNYHAYARPETFSTNHVRFPDGELKKSLLNAYKSHREEILGTGRFPYRQSSPSKGHSELTQAIVKDSGTINNYDASIPVRIPSKKPNKFEVKEILRNADVHFIDGTASEPDYDRGQEVSPVPASHYDQPQYIQLSSYQSSHFFDPSKTSYRVLGGETDSSQGLAHNHIDYYDQRDSASYIHHQQTSHGGREELSTSETIKVPVAVIKGTHALTAHGAYPIGGQRVGESTTKTKAFTPSSTSSDWIPMSGQLSSDTSGQASSASTTVLDTRYGDKYFTDLLKSGTTEAADAEPTRIITSNRNIGDIISGKIPSEYAPFKSVKGHASRASHSYSSSSAAGDIITGKIPFADDSEIDRRKGSVLEVNPSTADTSNLVVSSMIKFS